MAQFYSRKFIVFALVVFFSLCLLLFSHKIIDFRLKKKVKLVVRYETVEGDSTKPTEPTTEPVIADIDNAKVAKTSNVNPTISSTTSRKLITGRPGPTNVPIVVCGDRNDLIDVTTLFDSSGSAKAQVELFITILTAPHQLPRRMAIRETWLSTVRKYSVAYRFFTDGKDIAQDVMEKLREEQREFHDLELLPTKGGYWFSHRYLYALFWAGEHYSFNFYLRMDDDYFLCLNNLYNDLQYRKKEKLLYWGNMCCWPNLVAMDEGFVILGADLLREIVRRNNSLCCHPMGGQMIAMWVNRLDHEGLEVTYFQDNDRLKHYRNQLKGVDSNLCKNIFGVHESYPKQMHEYWNVTKDSWFTLKSDDFVKVERKEYKEYCSRPKGWDWRALSAHWKHEPKPCWAPGVDWPELKSFKFHKGRQ